MAELEQRDGHMTIIDSGSSLNLSGICQDFYQIEPVPTERITGVGGRVRDGMPVGHKGILRGNVLGITEAIYVPTLPNKRLISTQKLVERGWAIRFSETDSSLYHPATAKAVTMRLQGGLPVIEWNSGDGNGSFLTTAQAQADAEDEPEVVTPPTTRNDLSLGDVSRMKRLRVDAALNLHRRIGHLHVPGNAVENCPECLVSKGKRGRVKRVRGPIYKVVEPFEQINADFWGPIKPISMREMKYLFVMICDTTGYVWITPQVTKDAAYSSIKATLDEIQLRDAAYDGQKIVHRVRTDNEPTLRGQTWIDAVTSKGAAPMYSSPYLPQQNGVVERYMDTLGQGLRAILCGVDKTLWCYAAEYFAHTWNRVPRAEYPRLKWAKDLSPSDLRIRTRARRKRETPRIGPPSETVTTRLMPDRTLHLTDAAEQEEASCVDGEDSALHLVDAAVGNATSGVERGASGLGRVSESENPHFHVVDPKESLFLHKMEKFKRFGVLCFAYREPKINRPKLQPTRIRGVFLGYSKLSNSYLVGYWRPKGSDFEWAVLESESVRFTDYLVRAVRDLRPDSNSVAVSVDELSSLDSSLPDTVREDVEVVDDVFMCFPGQESTNHTKIRIIGPHELTYLDTGERLDQTHGVAPVSGEDGRSGATTRTLCGITDLKNSAHEIGDPSGDSPQKWLNYHKILEPSSLVRDALGERVYENLRSISTEKPLEAVANLCVGIRDHTEKSTDMFYPLVTGPWGTNGAQDEGGIPEGIGYPPTTVNLASSNGRRSDFPFLPSDGTWENSQVPRKRLFPAGQVEIGRGTPKRGGTSLSDFRMRERESKRRRVVSENPRGSDTENFTLDDLDHLPTTLAQNGERLIESHVYLSVKQAMASPQKNEWESAISKEKAKLEATRTWRRLSKDELGSQIRAIPIALLLTEKRDGTFKCRAVVLGNQCHRTGDEQNFAPVASWTALRLLTTVATREGDFIRVFDLDNAFLNAEMPVGSPPVYVSLPPAWREVGDRPIRRLLRALYGLPQSPILWYRKYEEGLRSLGWEVSPYEPGMWRKRSATGDTWIKMIIYVDDNVMCGPDNAELGREMGKILWKFPGREIPPVLNKDGFSEWDILGATWAVDRNRFVSRISIGSYIESMAKRFNYPDLAPKRVPTVPNPPPI